MEKKHAKISPNHTTFMTNSLTAQTANKSINILSWKTALQLGFSKLFEAVKAYSI